MARKRFSPEQIIVKLREAEIIESKGLTQVEADSNGPSSKDNSLLSTHSHGRELARTR